MMKNRKETLVIVALVLLGSIVMSCGGGGSDGGGNPQTPIIVTPLATNQTICYDVSGAEISCTGTGQDGELQMGIDWPTPRFTDNTDGTITDNLTGLMWLQDANCFGNNYPDDDNDATLDDGRVTWQHALDFVKGINAGTYPNCGAGHTDWRLPNKRELRSLINYSAGDSTLWLDAQGFNFVNPSTYYWSSTTRSDNPSYAQAVAMIQGLMGGVEKDSDCFVWPVRRTSTRLTRTGQTKCYEASGGEISCTGTGQDGDLQTGVAWPSTRFSANTDTTLTDSLTGLIWAPDGNIMPSRDDGWDTDETVDDGKVTWQHALSYVAKLNIDGYLGHSDWRLPNLNEIESLLREDPVVTATWLNTQGFSNVQPYEYWSSSNRGGLAGNVAMYTGLVSITMKTAYYYVWPVRGGQ